MGRKGLIGSRLSHSYSKRIHEIITDYTYDLIELTPEQLGPFLAAREFDGLNVTMPYKRDVIPYLDGLDPMARSIGAVNCIVNRGGRLTGYNTDAGGFDYMIVHNGIAIEGRKVLVLGNGGAAQAVLAVLRTHHPAGIVIAKPRPSEATVTMEECYAHHTDAQVIVNTSPVGMYPNVDASPLDLTRFPACEAVLDIIYNPTETRLLSQAKSLGMTAVNGVEMLVAQAFVAAELFTGDSVDRSRIGEIVDLLEREIAQL
ncbi:MAG: shikimate dehydrogenase [Lachnospiraceae bacterium]|nr:shikimate dehydrogenase [Lachnospiraceae bacterium]